MKKNPTEKVASKDAVVKFNETVHHRHSFGEVSAVDVKTGEVHFDSKVNCAADERACFASHMGLYMVEPMRGVQMANLILSGKFQATPVSSKHDDDPEDSILRVEEGVGIINITGVMQKRFSKFSGASTIFVRRQIAAARNRDDIKSLLLLIDSPGGAAAGNQALFDDIVAAGKEMSVHAHIEDHGFSAALFVAAAANTISINRGGETGSIGTILVIDDFSKMFKREGVTAHVITTGKNKGIGVKGAPVTSAHLKVLQKEVDDANKFFIEAIMNGRGMDLGDVLRIADGSIFTAEEALENGLVDSIMSDSEAFAAMVAGTVGKKKIQIPVDDDEDDDDTDDDDTPDVGRIEGPESSDTLRKPAMDLEQIKKFLQSDAAGKELLASMVAEGIEAKVKSGDLLTQTDADTLVKAAVDAEASKASEKNEIAKMARDIVAIDATAPLENVEAKLTECSSAAIRAERFKAMKAEATVLKMKNGKAPHDLDVVKSLSAQFESKWSAGEFGNPEKSSDATKAKAKAHWMKRKQEA